MSVFLTRWTVQKAFLTLVSVVALGAGIFAVVWQPERPDRGSLVLGSESAPLVITEYADFT